MQLPAAHTEIDGHEIVYRNGLNQLHAVPLSRYPSGEPLVNHRDVKAWEKRPSNEGQSMDRLLVRQRNMDAFMTAMFLVDAMTERGIAPPELILPFVPGARQDRLNPEGDYLFTIKSIAKLINDRNFPVVKILDPHSEVTPALIDRCKVYSPAYILAGRFPTGTWSGVVSPDAGSEKRANLVAHALGLEVVYGWKQRDLATGGLKGFGLQHLEDRFKDKPLLVVDDICDGGGTFVGLAEQIAAQGAKADLYVTHGIFAKGVKVLAEFYGRIITTDSVIPDKKNQWITDEQLGPAAPHGHDPVDDPFYYVTTIPACAGLI